MCLSATEKMNFYLVLINLNLNNYIWLMATVLDSVGID